MKQSVANPASKTRSGTLSPIYRWHVLNHLAATYSLNVYLEVGYFQGDTFEQVCCASKTAVDPQPVRTEEQIRLPHSGCMFNEDPRNRPQYIYKLYSDEFFQQLDDHCIDTRFDLIFIDGAHNSSQVDRDLDNSLRYLAEGGFVVLHDTNPPLLEYTTTGLHGSWTGDAYRSIIRFRQRSRNYYCVTVDVDWGCTIVTKHPRLLTKTTPDITQMNWQKAIDCWDEFSDNRTELLAVVSYDEFVSTFSLK